MPSKWNMEPFRLMALDPGGTTGIATSRFIGDSIENPNIVDLNYTTYDMGPMKHHMTLWDYIASFNPDTIICESFDFRQNYGREGERNKVELISREYIGVAELYCQMTKTKLVMQSASMGKNFVPDDKLDKTGILVTPSHPNRHKNDALRHLVRYQVVNLGIRSPITDSWRTT